MKQPDVYMMMTLDPLPGYFWSSAHLRHVAGASPADLFGNACDYLDRI